MLSKHELAVPYQIRLAFRHPSLYLDALDFHRLLFALQAFQDKSRQYRMEGFSIPVA
jgi:hypothetical protein